MSRIDLPPFLANTWRFHQGDVTQEFYSFIRESHWTVSDLTQAQIHYHIEAYKTHLEEQGLSYRAHGRTTAGIGTASLLSTTAAQLIELLESSDNFLLDVETLAKNLNPSTLLVILRDPRLHYTALRSFMSLPANCGPANAAETAKSSIDIDEAVLANESYIRSRGHERNKDGKGLVRLSDAEVIFGTSTVKLDTTSQALVRVVVRKEPPTGGFEFFDAKRPRSLQIQPSTEAFVSTFDRITCGILRGLNWDNVLVAGGMALTTLLHVKRGRDEEKVVKDCDIDIYIYGLTPTEANEKAKEIYRVWATNLPPSNRQKIVVKNSKTITFLADYPNRRIQIILKSLSSPTAALLNFDLDACALGFDGTNVLMLPRCARALETGYSTFTMNLIWGHHLRDRRATQDIRVFKYASRGFGLRILPSYVKSLEVNYYKYETHPRGHEPQRSKKVEHKTQNFEPGLKILKRIAYRARGMVHRFYYGFNSPTRPPKWMDDEKWGELGDEDRESVVDYIGGIFPRISISDLDTRDMHRNLPDGRQGVGGFEIWMRHHEAWKLDAEGMALLDLNSLSSTAYDNDMYDDLPEYHWGPSFDARRFTTEIDAHNSELFEVLREKICDRLHTPFHTSGWRGYLTRRIRRQVYGPDIDSVFGKQITIPIELPFKLEDYVASLVNPVLEEKGIYNGNEGEKRLLLPVHELGMGAGIIPQLVDSPTEGNLRYLVIGNELMWAGIDRRIDEVLEALQSLFRWGLKPPYARESFLYLALAFRRRIPQALDLGPLPMPDTTDGTDAEGGAPPSATVPEPPHLFVKPTTLKTIGTLSEYEARLFQQWALHVAWAIYQTHPAPEDTRYDEDANNNAPADELFWKDGMEGTGEIEWGDAARTQDKALLKRNRTGSRLGHSA
ncbi:MAG: hypothetical protein M1839_006821 [Geoglossum umbratile]|nr:MAG: hypothetical protein M1839_006821 [Geoglossum umbratile]